MALFPNIRTSKEPDWNPEQGDIKDESVNAVDLLRCTHLSVSFISASWLTPNTSQSRDLSSPDVRL